MSPWKVILATMVIFGCGIVTGALLIKSELPLPPIMESLAPHPAAHPGGTNMPPPLGQFQRPEFLRRIQKQLDLTTAETEKISNLMKESQHRTRPLWDEISPQLRAEMKRLRGEIREQLTPEQQKKMDDLLKNHPRRLANAPGERFGRETLGTNVQAEAPTNAP